MLTVASFGPFTRGVIDSADPSLDMTGALRSLKGFNIVGANKLTTRFGSTVSLTLKDDAGTPANVTSVCAVGQYLDRAYAIAHSTNTNKAYLYILAADLTGWYNNAGALQSNTTPQPAVVLWTSITIAPDVFVAEGLGFLYIAHAQGIDSSNLNFPTLQWDGTYPVAVTDLKGSGTGGSVGTDNIYANGVIAFHDHLFVWGYGAGAVVANAYRPELIRFSQPDFSPFQSADSLTIGNRVRSDRERVISAGIAGDALVIQGTYITSRITGYGRASWTREIVDESSGITGPKAGVSDDAYWYYWSAQGPMRIGPQGPSQPLYEPVAGLVASVVNPEKIVASRDVPNNLVMFHVDTGSGIRTRAAYHTLRNMWISAGDDDGLVIKATGEIAPVLSSTAAGVAPPSGPPTTPSTDAIGSTTARANWVVGDPTAGIQLENRLQGASSWTVLVSGAYPPPSNITMAGLAELTAYEWRVAHIRGGQLSAYLGPSAATQFTTTNQLQPPTNVSAFEVTQHAIYVTWTNSGETGVSTEVYVADPGSGVFNLKYTAAPGASSATVSISAGTGTYQVQIRHTKSGAIASNYDGPIDVVVT